MRKVEITYMRQKKRGEKVSGKIMLREPRSGAFDCSLLALGSRVIRGVRYPSACYGSLSSYKICV